MYNPFAMNYKNNTLQKKPMFKKRWADIHSSDESDDEVNDYKPPKFFSATQNSNSDSDSPAKAIDNP